ncbi:MAG: molybdenum cofactor guanylyltransferase [Desulfotomaculales bacterium]
MALNASAAVLVGGESRRMGKNKALLKLDEKTFVERTVSLLKKAFPEVFLVGNNKEMYRFLGLPVVSDVYEGCGPLAGIHAALLAARAPYVFVVACDMPFLNPKLISALLTGVSGWDVVVPKISASYVEPLCAVYGKDCLPVVEEHLQKGIYKVSAFYPRVRVKYVDMGTLSAFVPEEDFFNVNTPEDVQKAAFLLKKRREKGDVF